METSAAAAERLHSCAMVCRGPCQEDGSLAIYDVDGPRRLEFHDKDISCTSGLVNRIPGREGNTDSAQGRALMHFLRHRVRLAEAGRTRHR